MRLTFRTIAISLFLSLALWLLAAPPAWAAGTIDGSNCNATDVSTAISSGGVTDFTVDCSVTLSSTIVIDSDTTINGNGYDVVISGGDAVRVLFVSGGNVEINGITVADGYTYRSAEGGGAGLRQTGGSLIINDSTFRDNLADDWDTGGAILQVGNGATLTINRSTFTGNTGDYAGAIAASETLVLDNSTISGNTANAVFGYGTGGIYSTGDTTINHSTITGNSGASFEGFGGGGVTADGTSFTIQNSFISGNNVTGSSDHDCNSVSVTVASLGYNLVGQSGSANGCPSDGTGDVVLATTTGAALDASLLNNGGPTLTHALLSGSPAIDAVGDGASGCDGGVSIDQRGAVRADGANRGGAACDIGAYEYASNQAPTSVRMAKLQASSQRPGDFVLLIMLFLLLLGGASLLSLRRTRGKN